MTDHLTPENKSTHELLQKLWTKAVGTPGYDKEEWKALERMIGFQQRPDPEKRYGFSDLTKEQWEACLELVANPKPAPQWVRDAVKARRDAPPFDDRLEWDLPAGPDSLGRK